MAKRRRAWRATAFDVFLKVLVVLIFLAIIVFAIWLRNVMPCDWMPLKDAPSRCLTDADR